MCFKPSILLKLNENFLKVSEDSNTVITCKGLHLSTWDFASLGISPMIKFTLSSPPAAFSDVNDSGMSMKAGVSENLSSTWSY